MAQLELMRGEIARTEAQLACIAAEKATGMWKPAKFLAAHPVSFPFLLDEERIVTRAYGLYQRIGIDALNIAHPATVVVECDRKVSYIYRGKSQTDRAPFDQVLEAVKKISA